MAKKVESGVDETSETPVKPKKKTVQGFSSKMGVSEAKKKISQYAWKIENNQGKVSTNIGNIKKFENLISNVSQSELEKSNQSIKKSHPMAYLVKIADEYCSEERNRSAAEIIQEGKKHLIELKAHQNREYIDKSMELLNERYPQFTKVCETQLFFES